jgi:hypothetical protein
LLFHIWGFPSLELNCIDIDDKLGFATPILCFQIFSMISF